MTTTTRPVPVRLASLVAVLIAVLATALALVAPPAEAGAAAHHPAHHAGRHAPAVTAGGGYLALGDSVSFGFREAANLPTPDYSDAASFVGYPELVASALKLNLTNASCPGETSASLVDASAQSNGCESSPSGGPGYRTAYPLHTQYSGSQLAFAVKYLRKHPDTQLVSLMIGANDGFLCQARTTDSCLSEANQLVTRIKNHVNRTLHQLRQRAGYDGQIVVVTYYSLNYSDELSNLFSQIVNNAVTSAAAPYDVQVADGYAAFQDAAAQSGGDSCAAGLLTILTTGGCGVHPSVAGQNVLAHAVETQVQ